MCKVIMTDKETGEVLIEKVFADEAKANGLYGVLNKYADPTKVETKLETSALKKKKGLCKLKEKGENNANKHV